MAESSLPCPTPCSIPVLAPWGPQLLLPGPAPPCCGSGGPTQGEGKGPGSRILGWGAMGRCGPEKQGRRPLAGLPLGSKHPAPLGGPRATCGTVPLPQCPPSSSFWCLAPYVPSMVAPESVPLPRFTVRECVVHRAGGRSSSRAPLSWRHLRFTGLDSVLPQSCRHILRAAGHTDHHLPPPRALPHRAASRWPAMWVLGGGEAPRHRHSRHPLPQGTGLSFCTVCIEPGGVK